MELKVNMDSLREAVGQRESNGNYKAINTLNYVGKYQFGAAALEDLGLLKTGASKGGNSAVYNDANWTIEGGLEAFLANEKLQDKSFEEYAAINAQRLAQKNLFPSNPDAQAGLLAMSHLGGSGNAAKYMLTGEVFEDQYGTKLTEYEDIGVNSQRETQPPLPPPTGQVVNEAAARAVEKKSPAISSSSEDSFARDFAMNLIKKTILNRQK